MSTWQSLHYLNLLWLLFPIAALFIFAHRRNAAILRKIAASPQLNVWTASVNTSARVFKCLLFLLALAAIIAALARPVWNKKEQPFKAQGRDVVFVLDISRSMLAAHRNTTRLEEAKFAIQECLATIRGDRVALIIFAGNAKVACPLTHDYAYFRTKLGDVDYRSVTFGGTMLGDAIRLACTGIFKTKSQLYRDVIVITDGEDMQSNPIQAAEQLAEYNARLIAVGMGDESPTPLVIKLPDGSQETITDNGQAVMTRLDADTLLKMTEATPGGVFIPVPSDTTLNLNEIYGKFIELQLKQDFETHSVVTYEEKFQLFLAIAILLLAVAMLLPDCRKAAVLACALTVLSVHGATSDEEVAKLVSQAKAQIESKELDEAQRTLKQALELRTDSPVAHFNLAAIAYQKGNYQEAQDGFQRALALAKNLKEPIPGFEEKAHLGIAAAAYRLSRQQDNQDPKAAAKTAVENYKQALKCNPLNETTRPNLNKAKTNYKMILKQRQQQQQQNGDGQKNDNDSKDDDSQEQQKNSQNGEQKNDGEQQQKELEQLEKQQRQAEQDMKNGQKSQQEMQRQQQELARQLQNAMQKQQQQDGDNSQNQQNSPKDFLRQSQKKQQEAAQELNKKNMEAAAKAQKDAADFTQMAQQMMKQDKGEKSPDEHQEPQPRQQQNAQNNQASAEQQAEQQPAQPLDDARAMDAINMENINRLNRQRHSFTAPSAQNKDW